MTAAFTGLPASNINHLAMAPVNGYQPWLYLGQMLRVPLTQIAWVFLCFIALHLCKTMFIHLILNCNFPSTPLLSYLSNSG